MATEHDASPAGEQHPPAPSAEERTLFERGDAVRRAVLGDAHVDRSHASADAFSADFVEFITRYAWGAIWDRPGLSRRERSLITLALLAGLHRPDELPLHVRGALNNGLTPDEIKEVLLHTGIYAGVPASNTAFAVAKKVLAEVADDTKADEEPAG